MPPVVPKKVLGSRPQQPRAKATRARSLVAGDLGAVGAPAGSALRDGDMAVVAALGAAGVAGQQQAMGLHDPPAPFVIGR